LLLAKEVYIMTLPLPHLDDRRWVDLVDEGRALIPVYAPQWTDHNIHDPGITLMELFAWLTEMDIYRVNRIPEAHRLKFLALVGITPNPPQPAQTVVSLTLRDGNTEIELPASTEFEGRDPFGQIIRYRTLQDITIVPGKLAAIQTRNEKGSADLTSRFERVEVLEIFGNDPKPGASLYLGFSAPLPMDTQVSLFFTIYDARNNENERERIREERAQQLKACKRHFSPVPFSDPEHNSPVPFSESVHHSVRTVWEFLNDQGIWQCLDPLSDQVVDKTRAFTLDGAVHIKVPSEMMKKRIGPVDRDFYYIRCRFIEGAYDKPPLVLFPAFNGVDCEQAVSPDKPITWTIAADAVIQGSEPSSGNSARFRLSFNENKEISELTFINENNREIPSFLILDYTAPSGGSTGKLSVEAEFLGYGMEKPNQEFFLSQKPAHYEGFQFFTLEKDNWLKWHIRSDFDASDRDDAHIIVDFTEGKITAGDGENGRVIPKGIPAIVTYRFTHAEAGNLKAGAVNQLADTFHNRSLLGNIIDIQQQLTSIMNTLPVTGGEAEETADQAAGRALQLREKPMRAVTLEDYETLTRETPGVSIARVSARSNIHPSFPCIRAQGINTVIILPFLPVDKPFPSRGLIQAVTAYLSRRRVIGSRVFVIGPVYRDVTVQAQVQSCEGTNRTEVRQKIIDALNDFFHPLRGGPDKKGWPFGRDVYVSEVMQVIDETEGVDNVISLALIPDDDPPQCGNICLGSFGLVSAGNHTIEVL
jgi:hypothetical protein